MKTKEKPAGLEDVHLEYLDALRETGVTNMYGARPYLEREFRLSSKAASKILVYWMETFSDRHPR